MWKRRDKKTEEKSGRFYDAKEDQAPQSKCDSCSLLNEVQERLEEAQKQLEEAQKNIEEKEEIILQISNRQGELSEEYDGKRHILLMLQNHCIQGNCSSYAISDYILRSKELSNSSDKFGKSELHIITNELQHYDFTAISSLAIAVNIENNTKYIYYLPHESVLDFSRLKTQVAGFIKRERKSLVLVDSWLRSRLCDNHHVSQLIENELNGEYVDDIIEQYQSFPNELYNRLKDAYLSIATARGKIKISDDVFEWIGGCETNSKVGEFIQVIRKIETTCSAMASNLGERLTALQNVWKLLINLYDFSKWLLDDLELAHSDITRLLNYLMKDDEIPEIDQIRRWIVGENSNMAGASHVDGDEISDMIEHNLICIDISKCQVTPCYSFCLYLGQKYDDISVAWYTCHADSGIQHRGVTDNQITIHTNTLTIGINNREFLMFTNAYKYIIDNTPGAMDVLRSNGCDLIYRLVSV